jgi:polyhydroxybutyrate depolymerase
MTAKPIVIALTALTLLAHAAFVTFPIEAQTGECSPAKPAIETGSTRHTLTSGDIEREYIVYVPSGYDPAQPTPLVLSLHGYTSNAVQQQLYTGWNDVAERETFIVVYPQATGSPTRWFAYHAPYTYAGQPTTDDVQFVRDLLARLSEDYCADPARIYINGLSNGGAMTHRLACELADQIAAVGMVAGAFVQNESCEPARPIPVMAFHGTNDSTVPYGGGGYFEAVEEWTAEWAERNACDPASEALPEQGEVSGIAYVNCDEDAAVILYTIHGGGHTWPGASPLFDAFVNPTTQDIDANEIMWEFFVQHPLN